MSDAVENQLENLDEATRARIQRAGVAGMENEVRKIMDEQREAKQSDLRAKYTAEMTNLANRGKPQLIQAIREKYRRMGLDVDHIGFK